MPRVVIAGKIHPAGMEILRARADLELVELDDPGATIPAAEIARADAILIRYGVLTADAVRGAASLAVVSRHGVGCDNLPVAALSERGIPVTIVGPVNAVSVAEQAIAMLLAAIKRIAQYDAAVRSGQWSVRDSLGISELAGKRMLVLGFGRIGREVARRARAFDVEVVAYDPHVNAEIMLGAGVRKVDDWRAELPTCDVLTLHLPLSPETLGIVDAAVLAALRPTAILVNTARGELVDEDALYSELTTRMSAGFACLDTFRVEPAATDLPLMRLSNVIVSPHSSSLTAEAAMRMGIVAARNVLGGLDGTLDPLLIFNRAALEASAGR